MAHHGVLFLDELAEFARHSLDALRQPLENGWVDIVRAAYRVRFPAQAQLIAAMNPCVCGFSPTARCRCGQEQVLRYQARLSGPLLDRLDLQVSVAALDASTLLAPGGPAESSQEVGRRVQEAQARQLARQGKLNAQLSSTEVSQVCEIDSSGRHLLARAFEQFSWSGRSLHRVLRVARTLADLTDSELHSGHLAQAIQWRRGLLAANSSSVPAVTN